MSSLNAFLNPIKESEEKEVVISDRFVKRDEKGEPIKDKAGNYIPMPFKIRSLTEDENDTLQKKARRTRKVNGQPQEYVDNLYYLRSLVVAATVVPDFASEEMCKNYGVMDPQLVPGKMLLIGEYNTLVNEIMQLSGIEYNTVEDEAKN